MYKTRFTRSHLFTKRMDESSVSDPDPGISSFDQNGSGSGWTPDPDKDPECEEKRIFFSNSTYFFLDIDAALTLMCYKKTWVHPV